MTGGRTRSWMGLPQQKRAPRVMLDLGGLFGRDRVSDTGPEDTSKRWGKDVCLYIHIHTYIRLYIHIHIHIHTYIYTSTSTYTFICMHLHCMQSRFNAMGSDVKGVGSACTPFSWRPDVISS